MARNKYPEETVKKILDISMRLFKSKGFDKTSIQDIVEQLGMSKGAIYYHFKSKEEILDHLCHQVYNNLDWFWKIMRDHKLTGLEKLRKMFLFEIGDERKVALDFISRPVEVDPRMLVEHLKASVNDFAPMLSKVLEQGCADGSIRTAQPEEAAEVIIILANFWLNPRLFLVDKKRFLAKVRFYGNILDGVGVPMVDHRFLEAANLYYEKVAGS